MAWIHTIEPEHAEGKLKDTYGAIAGSRGGVAHVHRAQSLNVRALKAHLELYKAVVFARSSLPRLQRERIATVVSAANRCAYCVGHHGEAMAQLGDSPVVLGALRAGEIPAALPEKERALLEWARAATLDPSGAGEVDCQRLLALGWDDRALLDASLTTAYFNFVNRLVLMLGVDLEQGFERMCGDDASGSDQQT